MDFIGFTYNGKHSVRDLHIYRTSNGSRYDENLTATLTDKTADVPGGDGQYYFGTTKKNKTFTVQYAFDALTEYDLQQLKQVFSGDGIHDLIFDETPYKTWSAKVTGTASLKHICFEENEQRIYKGEGSITFTCYHPYAHSTVLPSKSGIKPQNVLINSWVDAHLILSPSPDVNNAKRHTLYSENYDLELEAYKNENGVWKRLNNISITANTNYVINTRIYIKKILFIGNSSLGEVSSEIKVDNETYVYSTSNCFERHSSQRDGRNLNHYAICDFPNKMEWSASIEVGSAPVYQENYGTLPAYFTLTGNSKNKLESGKSIAIGTASITLEEACYNLEWNSKTGIVKGSSTATEAPHFLKYTGNSIGVIEPGMNYPNGTTAPTGTTLTYQYWYN